MSTHPLLLNQPLLSVQVLDRSNASNSIEEISEDAVDNEAHLLATEIELRRVEQLEILVESIRAGFGALNAKSKGFIVDLQSLAVEIAILVAGRLLHDETVAGRIPIEETAKRLVANLKTENEIKLSISQHDMANLDDATKQMLNQENITLVSDPNLKLGECRADDGRDELIASLDLQLAELRHQLLENLHGVTHAI